MQLSTLYFRNRYLLVLTICVLMATGGLAVLTLPVFEDPIIVRRNPLVLTQLPGASAERVESLITEPIEEELRTIPEIKHVTSTSRSGISVVGIELQDAVVAGENERIFSQIRDKLGEAQRQFPPEASAPVLEDQRGATAYTIIAGFTWQATGPPDFGILSRHADALSDRLRNIGGTQVVDIFGDVEEEIVVTVDSAELALLGLTPADVAHATRQADAKTSAGTFRDEDEAMPVEVTGAFDTVRRVAAVPLRSGEAGSMLRVGDVAIIEKAQLDPPTEIAITDNERTVLVAARMGRGERVPSWSANAKQAIDEYAATLGDGVELEVVFDQNVYTVDRIRELVGNLLLGAAVVVLVIFVFMGWRSSLIVGSTLPLVSASVLFALLLLGGELHQMAIFGMIIALGLLIDNAIVVTDEVNQHLAAGEERIDAVKHVVKKYFAPLLASTLTTVLAFAPIALLPGSGGDFISGIAISVILAIIGSFAVAMTVIVTLAGLFAARPLEDRPGAFRRFLRNGVQSDRVTSIYRGLLRLVVRFPVVAVIALLSMPAAGVILGGSLGQSFFPPTSRDMFDLKVWLPQSASIDKTRELAEEIDAATRQLDGVERLDWLIGGSYPSVYYNLVMNQDNSPHYAQAVVHTTDAATTERVLRPLQDKLSQDFPQARIVVNPFGQGPPVAADIEYRIFGDDLPTLQRLGEQMRLKLQQHPDVLTTNMSVSRGLPKLWLDADEDEADLAGLDARDLAAQLAGNLSGVVGGSVLEGLQELPVRVRQSSDGKTDLETIASTSFAAPSGEFVPLEAVGNLAMRPADTGISHYDGLRVNTVEAYTRDGALPIDIANSILQELEDEGFTLPPGYRVGLGGEVEQSGSSQNNLAKFAPALLLTMVATLVLTFRSVRMAMLLGVVAASCVGFAIMSTWSISLPFGFNTILGTLGLIGVALNDSIVVISSIRGNDAARNGDREALVSEIIGCTRHVLSTTLTTLGGFAPLLLLSEGDFWPSLAIVLFGGIVGAMLLALFMIPAAYVLLHPRKFGLIGPKEHTPAFAKFAAATLAVVVVAGCTVGPDYEAPPAHELPVADAYLQSTTRNASPILPETPWWRQYDDPTLELLVSDAVEANKDLEIAVARLREARALRRAARGGFFPQVSGSGAYARTRLSENGPGIGQAANNLPGIELEQDLYQVAFDASWELDVFGGTRRRVQAADAREQAAIESTRDLAVIVASEVVREYAELRGTQTRLIVAERNIDLQEQTLDLVQRKRQAGLVPESDVARAQTQVETTKAALPPLRAAQAASMVRLATLVAQPAPDVARTLNPPMNVPQLPPMAALDAPADLLRRRPDIRLAERELAAAVADVGVATSDLYPTFRLVGTLGLESVDSDEWFDAASRFWQFGPGVTLPLFTGGRLRANVDAAEARADASLARYEQTVLLAVEEVETAAARRREAEAEVVQLDRALAAARRSVELATVLYDRGLRDFQVVLDAQQALVDLEDRRAAVAAGAVGASASLAKALGGGWRVLDPLAAAIEAN